MSRDLAVLAELDELTTYLREGTDRLAAALAALEATTYLRPNTARAATSVRPGAPDRHAHQLAGGSRVLRPSVCSSAAPVAVGEQAPDNPEGVNGVQLART